MQNKIARLCLDHFDSFSFTKRGRPEEGKEWTVLASFVQEQSIGEYLESLLVVFVFVLSVGQPLLTVNCFALATCGLSFDACI